MPCKFAVFSSVNNLSNLSGYFSAFDHTSLQENQNGTVTFMNFGCLSNDDGEGKENVLSYQMNARFFLNFFAFISYRVLGTAPNFRLKEETEFVLVLTSSKQRRKRKFTVVFVQVVKKSALDVQNLFSIYLLGSLPSSSPPPSSLLPGFTVMDPTTFLVKTLAIFSLDIYVIQDSVH